MDQTGSLRERIRDIAARRERVTLADIESVMNELKGFMPIESGTYENMRAWSTSHMGIVVSADERSPYLRPSYVRSFLNAMISVGLYD